MPIFEYRCADCSATFEELVRGSDANPSPACPRCGGTHTARIFSVFGFSGTSRALSASSSPSCSGCSSKHCATCK
ncbi:MAG: FmdB family zinc ribbon protein [Candidatus Oleimicrobiaceae bacterium]